MENNNTVGLENDDQKAGNRRASVCSAGLLNLPDSRVCESPLNNREGSAVSIDENARSIPSSTKSTPRRKTSATVFHSMSSISRAQKCISGVLYEPDKNGLQPHGFANTSDDFTKISANANVINKSSKASVHPSGVGFAARDAFGPKLTIPTSPDISQSLPQTPSMTPEFDGDEFFDDQFVSEKRGSDSVEIDPDTLYFRDGRRRIDMVLVYQEENEGVMTELEARRREQRRTFQQNLLKEGLQLELESKENSFDGKTFFLKLHIPWKIKMQYAEVMNLKLPTKRFITISVKAWQDTENAKGKRRCWENLTRWFEWFNRLHTWDTSKYPEEPSFYASTDSGDREER